MTPTVTSVPPRYLPSLWGKLVPHFEKGRKFWGRFYDLEDLYEEIKTKRMQLWVHIVGDEIKCVLLTSMSQYPRGKYLRYVYIGGSDLRAAGQYVYIIENWAKESGAIGFELLGRPGWEKMLTRKTPIGSFDKILDRGNWLVGEF